MIKEQGDFIRRTLILGACLTSEKSHGRRSSSGSITTESTSEQSIGGSSPAGTFPHGKSAHLFKEGGLPEHGDKDPRKVVILGIPWSTVDTTLLQHFSQYGVVEGVQIMREKYTGKSRGFGFITFSSVEEAQKAIGGEHVIDGRRCEAKHALPEGKTGSSRTTRIFVARIPSSVTDFQFRNYFEQFGQVQDAYMPKDPSKQGHRGIGFVTFASPDMVDAVMARTHVLNGNEVAIDKAAPKEKSTNTVIKTASSGNGALSGRLSMSQPNLHVLAAMNREASGSGSVSRPGFVQSGTSGASFDGNLHAYPLPAMGIGGSRRFMSHPSLSAANMEGSQPHSVVRDPKQIDETENGEQHQALVHFAHQAQQAHQAQHQAQAMLQTILHHHHTQNVPHKEHTQGRQQQFASSSIASGDFRSGAVGPLPVLQQQQNDQQQLILDFINASASTTSASHSLPYLNPQAPRPGYPPSGAASTGTSLKKPKAFPGGVEVGSTDWEPRWGQQQVTGSNGNGRSRSSNSYNQIQHINGNGNGNETGNGNGTGTGTGGIDGPASAYSGPRMFVGKLTRDTNEQDVKEYFSRFGFVLDVYLPRDKSNKREHRGFGFVTFETQASIGRVIAHRNHYIKGSLLAIDSAVPRLPSLHPPPLSNNELGKNKLQRNGGGADNADMNLQNLTLIERANEV